MLTLSHGVWSFAHLLPQHCKVRTLPAIVRKLAHARRRVKHFSRRMRHWQAI